MCVQCLHTEFRGSADVLQCFCIHMKQFIWHMIFCHNKNKHHYYFIAPSSEEWSQWVLRARHPTLGETKSQINNLFLYIFPHIAIHHSPRVLIIATIEISKRYQRLTQNLLHSCQLRHSPQPIHALELLMSHARTKMKKTQSSDATKLNRSSDFAVN